MKPMLDYPFPFVGAGDARYFERAWLFVRLKRAPKKSEQAFIAEHVPPPFRWLLNVSGHYLTVACEETLHLEIIDTYEADDGDSDDEGGRVTFAAPSRVHRFNEGIEHWLRAVHEVTPIVVAVRPQDGEAGGTDFSDWHHWSLSQPVFDDLMNGFAETLRGPKNHELAATVLEGILDEAADCEGLVLSEQVRAWMQPSLQLVDAIRSGSHDRVRELVAGVEPHTAGKNVAGACALLDRGSPSDIAAFAGVSEALTTTEQGWHGVLAFTAATWENSKLDSTGLTAVLEAGTRWQRTLEEAFLAAAAVGREAYQGHVYRVGALHLQSANLVNYYLWTLTQTKQAKGACEDALALAEPVAAWAPAVLLNLTNVLYERGEFKRGIALVETALTRGELAAPMLLNAALLYAGAGEASQAREYAQRSHAAGDLGATMIEPALLLQQGSTQEALEALMAVKAGGYESFDDWRDDLLFRQLFDDPRFIAIFG